MLSRGRGVSGAGRWIASLGLVFLLSEGCGGEVACPPLVIQSDSECQTTDDCVQAGFTTLRCVNRICALPCVSDSDCVLSATQECIAEQGTPPAAVCERRTCRPACPETPCANDETCHLGRCVLAVEDFEIRPGEVVGSFERFGWNALATEIENKRTLLVTRGNLGCSLGDDNCAGPPASGEAFAVLGTQETTEKGTAEFGLTCRPCACCLECVTSPYPDEASAMGCPISPDVPAPLMCPAVVPPTCSAVCTACEMCPAAGAERVTENLVACEATAAAKTCPADLACDAPACRACWEGPCGASCADIFDDACRACEQASCPTCGRCRRRDVCREARTCERITPEECGALRTECDALEGDGCYPTPIRYPRSQLRALEQSLVSPEIDLAGVSGALVLSFAYVPFSVGESYFESEQGVPASMWQRQPQELVVELCGGGCELESNWQLGEQAAGGAASVPPESRRNNGLSLGKQSEVDWRSGRVEVLIPDGLRT
ncbi:MAG: hypothetical protein AAFU79_20360, partial [Myxococcota bacterium]